MAQTTIPLKLEAGSPPPREADPENIKDAIALLERYWVVNDDTTVRSPRAHLVSWVIQNQPDVCLNNPWLLFINPDDKANFAAVRQLWLKQLEDTGRIPAFCKMLVSLSVSVTARLLLSGSAKLLRGISPSCMQMRSRE